MSSAVTGSTQLCIFKVSGLAEDAFALTLPEVLAIGSLPEVLPVPFCPAYMLGLTLWQDRLVTVIDLGAALLGKQATPGSTSEKSHYLIAQTLWGSQTEVVAWPIEEGADTRTVTLQDVRLSHEPLLNRDLIYSTIHTQDRQFILINTTGFMQVNPQVQPS